jgi:holo-[acyl-carrier protein] synthase
MIVGIGVDLVAIDRLARAIETHGDRFEGRVFSDDERAQDAYRRAPASALAARFAAKEACMKALGLGLGQGLAFRLVDVVTGEDGRPRLGLHGAAESRAAELGVRRVHLAITRGAHAAAALVVLEA